MPLLRENGLHGLITPKALFTWPRNRWRKRLCQGHKQVSLCGVRIRSNMDGKIGVSSQHYTAECKRLTTSNCTMRLHSWLSRAQGRHIIEDISKQRNHHLSICPAWRLHVHYLNVSSQHWLTNCVTLGKISSDPNRQWCSVRRKLRQTSHSQTMSLLEAQLTEIRMTCLKSGPLIMIMLDPNKPLLQLTKEFLQESVQFR